VDVDLSLEMGVWNKMTQKKGVSAIAALCRENNSKHVHIQLDLHQTTQNYVRQNYGLFSLSQL
jgi:hypothetical protein